MKVNVTELTSIMNKQAKGNYHLFAKHLNVDVGQLHRVLNGKGGAGAKFISAVLAYCKAEKIPIEQVIFLP